VWRHRKRGLVFAPMLGVKDQLSRKNPEIQLRTDVCQRTSLHFPSPGIGYERYLVMGLRRVLYAAHRFRWMDQKWPSAVSFCCKVVARWSICLPAKMSASFPIFGLGLSYHSLTDPAQSDLATSYANCQEGRKQSLLRHRISGRSTELN
jgi:hypothetical protein